MRIQKFIFLPFWLFTSIFISPNVKSVSGQCLPDQKTLLLELKNNLTFDSSVSAKLVHWNEHIDCCKWQGLECDNSGHVIGLDLSGESISAGINDSSTLFSLLFLQNLSLAQNNFDSIPLPSNFDQLSELSRLNLSDSGFMGQVPRALSKLTRLVTLDLSTSIFRYMLQVENPNLKTLIQNLTGLKELRLDGVNISEAGNEWCEAISSSLPNLQVLSLSDCFLSGPFDPSLTKIQSLSVIHLNDNTFSSSFPKFFADFANLTSLNLGSCDLFGVVPEKIFQMPNLQKIDLWNNRELEGSLPEFPENGSYLEDLSLSYTKFSGRLPDSIGNLNMLTHLDLRACDFTGQIPKSLEKLTQLVELDLSMNNFTGSIPSFRRSRKISSINLYNNHLTGEIFSYDWETFEDLNFLDLSGNFIGGHIPASLFPLPSLRVLRLSNNTFSGRILELPNFTSSPLEVLELDTNKLEGPMPEFIFKLYNLSALSLASNRMTGDMELKEFGKLENLVSLDLSYNMFSLGTRDHKSIFELLPKLETLQLASCKLKIFPLLKNHSDLMMLDLSNNEIDGEIPNWIWDVGDGFLRFLNLSHNRLTSLEKPYTFGHLHFLDLHSNMLNGDVPLPPYSSFYVDFSSNNFASSLPIDIGNRLSFARFFYIPNNKVIGSIPLSICNASQLQVLDLSNNRLQGKIPSCLAEMKNLVVLNLQGNKFSGNIPQKFRFPLSKRWKLEALNLVDNQISATNKLDMLTN